MKVILAKPRGFCAGVVRAIEIVERALDKYGPPVYVRHEIVHNKWVVDALKARGARFVEELSEVPPNAITIFSAHGVAKKVQNEAAERGLRVLNATCPLVSKVHAQGRHYLRNGRTVILIGHAGHPEVEGTLGQIPGPVILVQTEADVGGLDLADDTPIAYVTQTTLSVDDTEGIIAALFRRFKDVVGPGTQDICYATQNRQTALLELTELVDVIFVVGAQEQLKFQSAARNRRRSRRSHPSDRQRQRNQAGMVARCRSGWHHRRCFGSGSHGTDVIDALRAVEPVEVFTLPGQDEHIEFRVPVELLDVTGANKSARTVILGIPLLQKLFVGSYVVRQRLTGRKRYPLVLMLEPLFRCNLACAGCGKIDYPRSNPAPEHVGRGRAARGRRMRRAGRLDRRRRTAAAQATAGNRARHRRAAKIRLSVHQRAADGQEAFAVRAEHFFHLVGASRRRQGDARRTRSASRAPMIARSRRSSTPRSAASASTSIARCSTPRRRDRVAAFFDTVMAMGVDGITVSPGLCLRARARSAALPQPRPHQAALPRCFHSAAGGKKWSFSQSSLFLDFLAGNQNYHCTPWGNPTRTIFGWQKPCYLLGEGYAPTFNELMNDTDWDSYGTGNYEKCADCMVHSGYEASAVQDAVAHPMKALAMSLRGVGTEGAMKAEIPLDRQRPAQYVFSKHVEQKLEEIRTTKEKPELLKVG